MKEAIFSIIFASLYLLTSAQSAKPADIPVPVGGPYAASTIQTSGVPDENAAKDSIYIIEDTDKNLYHIIRIGDQLWMAENLKTTRLNDGTIIPEVEDYGIWSRMISPGYCSYNNDSKSYKGKYGLLYNGYTISTGKLCPTGWHVPTAEEWRILTQYCGDNTAGGRLKETGNWMKPNTGATNTSGFTALPGGSRGNRGSFLDQGIRGHWWSSSESPGKSVWNRSMSYSDSNVTGSSDQKQSGLSVRCVKNK